MNHIGTVPMRTRPISYQPLRAGQFRGYGGCNVVPSRTTIINNNIINSGYGTSYGNNCCSGGGGMGSGMKWMMGIGMGTTLLGGILSMFGFGGKKAEDGQGAEEPPANNGLQDQVNSLNDTVKSLREQLAESLKPKEKVIDKTPVEADPDPATVDPKDTEKPESTKIDFSKFKDGEMMNCIDNGGPKPVNGKLSGVETNENGVPTKFTITDTSTNAKGNTYEYVLEGTAEDGTPTYKCVRKNGQNVIDEQKYTFKDGILVQNKEMPGFGTGIRTTTDTKKTVVATPEIAEVPEGTMKDEVSNKYSSLTPYFNKKDGKFHSTPDQDHSYRDLSYNPKSSNTTVQSKTENESKLKFASKKVVDITRTKINNNTKLTDAQKQELLNQVATAIKNYNSDDSKLQGELIKIIESAK